MTEVSVDARRRGGLDLAKVARGACFVAILVGIVTWALDAGIVALWSFVAAAALAALVLPFPYALVSPLYMGLLGWLVDMLPFVVLAGWAAVTLRWLWGVVAERRRPLGGRLIWVPIGLLLWIGLSAAVNLLMVGFSDIKHFMLLVGIQALISIVVLAVVDQIASLEDRTKVLTGLLAFVALLTAGVFLRWVGVPFESLQASDVSERVEAAYGVDAFENNVGMIKWARAEEAGVGEWRQRLRELENEIPDLPTAMVFLPKFKAFDEYVLVRFDGSAREYEDELAAADIELAYDNVGLAPASLVPRWRSFPRNALTYAGLCAALFPFALFLAWRGEGWRRTLGRVAAFCCLTGAGFALARGAWAAILLGIAYLLVDGLVGKREKLQAIGAFVLVAVLFTALFLVLYKDDPLTARAGADSSISTREELYSESLGEVGGIHILLGFGSERSRTDEGGTRSRGAYGKYIPPAGTHSTYLNYLYRGGVIGALGILALYGAAGLHARAAARERQGAERTYHTLAATAVLVAAAHAAILSLYVEPVYTLTIALVLGLALAGATELSRSVLPWKKA